MSRATASGRLVISAVLLLAGTTCGSDGAGPALAGPGNEPPGFTPLTEHYFNTILNTDSAGFGTWHTSAPPEIVSDPTAPRSPPSVAQFTYPAGYQAGSAPARVIFDLPPNLNQLYLSFWMKLSSRFEGQDSETNKVFYVWIAGHPWIYLTNQGAGTAVPLMPMVRYQGTFDTRANFPQNRGVPQPMTRGQWRHWELLLIANTPGLADGVIRYWIDGQQVAEYTDVRFRGGADNWEYVYLQPIWGGRSGFVTATQYLWVDHVYVSGRN